MNLRFVQITFLLVAVLFTVENIYNRFFTKKVTHHTNTNTNSHDCPDNGNI